MNARSHRRSHLYTGAVLWGLMILATGCGGGAKVIRPEPLCQMPLPGGLQAQSPLRPKDWISLILDSEVTGEGFVATHTCTGEAIEPVAQPHNCLVTPPYLGDLRPVPLTEASVVERRLTGERHIVWIITHRYPNGDAFGPVAVTRHEGKRVIVGALGNLRLRSTRVELDVWDIDGRSVLVGQGETCRDEKRPATCKRAANLLVYHRQRLLTVPVRYREGQCVDMPWIELHMESDQDLETGWNRHFEIDTTVGHDRRYVVVTEQVKVQDSDPKHPDTPSRTVREVDTERFLHVEGPRLLTKQHPLWPRILPAGGKVQLTRELPDP